MPRRRSSDVRRSGPKPSDLFEQQIHRIHELIEGFDAEVTWDDRIIDPDQPSLRRQIDVTVKRDGRLTIIECRLHASRQNVKWIEELIERRRSLAADGVIAVSASGFTKAAIAKARRYGIVVRDLLELSDDDVREWGRSVELTMYFFAYSDVVLTITLSSEGLCRIDTVQARNELAHRGILATVFNQAAKLVGQRLIPAVADQNLTVTFGFRGEFSPFTVCGEPVLNFAVKGKARMVSKRLSAATEAYGTPSQSPANRDAIVERFDAGETSIMHDGHRISTHIDLASLNLLHQFRYVSVNGKEILDHEVFSISGYEALYVHGGPFEIEFDSYG